MSRAWDQMMERVGALEDVATRPTPAYDPTARRNDTRLERAIQRAGEQIVTYRFPGVTARTGVTSYTTHAWGSSYATSGETPSPLPESLVPGFLCAVCLPRNGYTFQYDASADKILAYTTAGTEVVATTNLQTAVGTTDIIVHGRGETLLDAYYVREDVQLVAASFRVSEAVAKSATNYWTLELRARADGESYGRPIGRRVVTDVRGLAENVEIPLYDTVAPTVVAAGDRVVLSASAATASASPLGDVVLTLVLQRGVV